MCRYLVRDTEPNGDWWRPDQRHKFNARVYAPGASDVREDSNSAIGGDSFDPFIVTACLYNLRSEIRPEIRCG